MQNTPFSVQYRFLLVQLELALSDFILKFLKLLFFSLCLFLAALKPGNPFADVLLQLPLFTEQSILALGGVEQVL